MFQTQSDTSPCMTTNTFGISQGTQKGEVWLGDRTGEIETRMVLGSSSVTLGSCCFLLCSFMGLYTTVGMGVASFTSLGLSLMRVGFCIAEWLLFQCLQWMILLFLDPWIKLFDFGISALQIARWVIKSMCTMR